MTERLYVYLAAFGLLLLALTAMGTMHREHYKNRKWQLLESRVATLEKIIVGDHD